MTSVGMLFEPSTTASSGDKEALVEEEGEAGGGEGWVAGGSREGEILIWRLEGGRFSLSQQIPAHKRQVDQLVSFFLPAKFYHSVI